jgi:hypothetical protein
MTLSSPNIVGCLSPLSRAVRLTGQIPGAEVEVQKNGAMIAKAVATSFDEVFNFDLGASIATGDKITATQSLSGDTSPPTPVPLEVQRVTPPFAGHRFISHIYRCGVSLFVGGIVPGAEIHLSVGAVDLGSATSVDGGAVVNLKSPIGSNQVIEARQVVSGTAGPVVPSPPADDPPQLANFRIEDPLACAPGIMAHGVVDAAEVLVRTDAANPATERDFKVPVRDQYLALPALKAGQKLLVQEVMRRCELKGAEQQYVVQPMSFASKPVIVGPLCAGTVRVLVKKVFPGAALVAKQGSTIVGQSVAYAEDVEIWTSPLAGGQDLIVTASLCGASTDSYGEAVDAAPATIDPCTIVEPLMDCSMQLWVTGAHAGGLLGAFSDHVGQISEWVRAPAAEAVIDLVSALVKGHKIRVVQIACGSAPADSTNTPTVSALAGLPAPVLESPVFADRPYIRAMHAAPGALVQLYSRETGYVSEAVANFKGEAALPRTGLASSVVAGMHVFARQIMCDQISGFSEPVQEVIDRTPYTPVIVSPMVHAVAAPHRPSLTWSDPGTGTIHEATQFLVQLSTPDHPYYDAWVVNEVVTAHSYALTKDLNYGAKYIWQVTAALGDPGFEVRSKPGMSDFTVEGAPTPPPPPPTPGFSKALIYNCSTDHRSIDVYKRDITAGEALTFIQTLGTSYDDWGTCPGIGAEPLTIDLVDGHFMQIVFVDSEMIGCMDENGGVDPERSSCQRDVRVLLGKASGPMTPPIIVP